LRPCYLDLFLLWESLDQLRFARQPEMLCFAIGTTGMGKLLRHPRQCVSIDMNTGGKIATSLGTSYE
jgi:hypothetical protein